MEPNVVLTDEQIAFYHENGYLSIPNIMPLDEVATMREIYDRLFRERAGPLVPGAGRPRRGRPI